MVLKICEGGYKIEGDGNFVNLRREFVVVEDCGVVLVDGKKKKNQAWKCNYHLLVNLNAQSESKASSSWKASESNKEAPVPAGA